MSRGSTWNRWDFHLHTPFSELNNQYGSPIEESTWERFVSEIEKIAHEKNIVAIGVTDYFVIDGYKKLLEYQKKGRLSGIYLFPNIEFRIDKIVTIVKDGTPKSKRLNLHVLLSPEILVEDIEEYFLHELDFAYENNPFKPEETSKLKRRRLEDLGKKLKEEQAEFKNGKSDFGIGCLNAVVDPNQVKELLEKKSLFRGNYLITLAEENLSLLEWTGQDHNTRKNLMQMAHAVFSSNRTTRDFCLGKKHNSIKDFISEFKSRKPCIWGCDGHSFDDSFLQPCKNNEGEINYCWIKCKISWEGLKQILYEPEERVKIQEETPEYQKSIFSIDKLSIASTSINESLKVESTVIELNSSLVSVIGGRGSGKTALLDLIASCFKEGSKLLQIKPCFVSRLYAGKNNNNSIKVSLQTLSSDSIQKEIGKDNHYFEHSNILYITQNHFEEFSSDYSRLNNYVLELIFQKFPDEKSSYNHFKNETEFMIAEIQKMNLEIQQLHTKIDNKNELFALLKQKEGEKRDNEKRILEIEDDSAIGKEIKELTQKIDKYRTKKQKIESLILNMGTLNQKVTALESTVSDLVDLNQTIHEISPDILETFRLYPNHKLSEILNEIKDSCVFNENYCRKQVFSLVEQIKNCQLELAKYDDRNKVLTQLREKLSTANKEIELLKGQIAKIDEFEMKIKHLEEKRLDYLQSVLVVYIKWKSFLDKIILELGNREDQILRNLSFEVSLNLREEEINKAINEKVNHTYLSEKEINNQTKNLFFSKVNEFIIKSYEIVSSEDDSNLDEIFQSKIDYKSIFKSIDAFTLDLFSKSKKNVTYSDFYDTVYQQPLDINFDLKLGGVPLENQSMGQRAIVLLKIILALDDRTLIIDQPEEDLDNRYIYEQLVFSLREAKKKRQIIIATHNANLVVNTDSEQIIIATCNDNTISYECGALEDAHIRETVKNVLEGGDEAFSKREEKYGYIF